MADDDAPFLARWARRKAQARSGVVPAPPAPPAPPALPVPGFAAPQALAPGPMQPDASRPSVEPSVETPPAAPLTLDDVASLTPASDYSRFVAPGVDAGVSNAAMRKLFTDPHFNVMDRLDIYIDDYGQPDPIPASMLRQMVQAKFLGLFDDEEKDAAARASALAGDHAGPAKLAPVPATIALEPAAHGAPDNEAHDDHHPDLRLQPDDAAGRCGPDEDAGPRQS